MRRVDPFGQLIAIAAATAIVLGSAGYGMARGLVSNGPSTELRSAVKLCESTTPQSRSQVTMGVRISSDIVVCWNDASDESHYKIEGTVNYGSCREAVRACVSGRTMPFSATLSQDTTTFLVPVPEEGDRRLPLAANHVAVTVMALDSAGIRLVSETVDWSRPLADRTDMAGPSGGSDWAQTSDKVSPLYNVPYVDTWVEDCR